MYATHIYLKILAVSTGITLTALGASSACAQGFDTVRLHGAPGIDAGSFSAALTQILH